MDFPRTILNYSNTRFNLTSILVFLLLIVPINLSGQSGNSLEEYLESNTSYPGEKVYLHLDRPDYIQGDTIWFKAYSWYGYDQIPDTISGILYVDLISPEGRIKLKRKLLIKNGTSQGDFCLDTTISPGRYTLRAYTLWMQNLNTGEPFYQSVIVNQLNQNFHVECNPIIIKQPGNDSLQIRFRFFEMNQRGELSNSDNHKINYSLKIGDQSLYSGSVMATNTKEEVFKCSLSGSNLKDSVAIFGLSINDDRLTFEKQFRIPLQERIDLQFFPEGGELVNGLESKVAFKALGTDGLSREVKGEIMDGDENVVTGFESSHKGTGAFLLKPEAGKEYFAHLWYNNLKYIILIPPALEEGCIMSVSFTGSGNNPCLSIKYSPLEANTQKYIIGSAYGKIRFAYPVKMAKDSCRLRIPLGMLPEGVCRLTVLDSYFEPECERLIYVDKRERFKIEVKPDSSCYGTRSKVTLLIKTTGLDGEPVQTDLSLAVVDKEQITEDAEVTGICAYKLLQSELKGYIEDANFYFTDDSCTNHYALDLLMLTQGYRKFLPGNTNTDEQKFQPEKNVDISGRIKFSGSKSREKKFDYQDIGLTLMSRSENIYFDLSGTDSLGRFRFQIPFQYGKPGVLLQASTGKGKPFRGEIFLDEPVTPPEFTPPPPFRYVITPPAFEYVRRLQAVKKTEISQTPWIGSMSKILGEVTVTAKAKNWYRDFESEAEKIADLDSLDPNGKKYENIYDLLIWEFGAKSPLFFPGALKQYYCLLS